MYIFNKLKSDFSNRSTLSLQLNRNSDKTVGMILQLIGDLNTLGTH